MNKVRPALLLLSASLIPVIILAAGMEWFFVTEQRRSLDDDVRLRADTIAATVQRELNTQIQLLSVSGTPIMPLRHSSPIRAC